MTAAEPKYGRYAKKRFGQHFLHDGNTVRRIVAALDLAPGDKVLEIGPGHGAMTGEIASAEPGLYAAIERDPDLALELPQKCPGVQPLCADAMDIRWEGLGAEKAWKIAGNLPYNVASPIMWDVFSRARGMERAVFMVQKEVGQRLAAVPGNKSYGALSVWVQSFVAVRLLFIVGPGVFTPKPKVDSAVLSFFPLDDIGGFDPVALSGLIKMCFQKRRKQLGNTLKSLWSDELQTWFDEQGLTSKARPEELTPIQFQALSDKTKTLFTP